LAAILVETHKSSASPVLGWNRARDSTSRLAQFRAFGGHELHPSHL